MIVTLKSTFYILVIFHFVIFGRNSAYEYRIAQKFVKLTFVEHQDKHITEIISNLKKANSYYEGKDDTLKSLLESFVEQHDLITVQAKALGKFFSGEELKYLIDMEKQSHRKKVFSQKLKSVAFMTSQAFKKRKSRPKLPKDAVRE